MSSKTWLGLSGLVLLAAFFAALGAPARSQEGKKGRKYALLVGVRSYDHSKLVDLKYTENDAEEMARVLTKAKYDEVVVLTTSRGEKDGKKKPTKANIERELSRLLGKVTKHDLVLMGLAGHGVQYEVRSGTKKRDESFFCPADAKLIDSDDFDKLAATMLSFRDLFKQLDDSGAGSRLLLIDACRNDPGTSRNADTDAMPKPTKGTAALFSCKGGERAFESDKLGKGHGVFFYQVIEALEGKAKNDDGEVTWDDLTRHVRRAVVKSVPELIRGGARQTPHLMANVEGDPVLLRVADKDLLVKQFEDDFSKGAERWKPTDANAWKVIDTREGKAYSQFAQSDFKPKYRSPFNYSLVKDLIVGDFVLEAKVQSTGKDAPHRDVCLFFGWQSPERYYYVHIAKEADDRANQIFIVNDRDRVKISKTSTAGTKWTDGWHRVKVVRKVKDGTIEVYFDDMKKPIMTATDRTFAWGQVGVGSFDDTGNWREVKVHGVKVDRPRE